MELTEICATQAVPAGGPTMVGETSIQVTDEGPGKYVLFQRVNAHGLITENWPLPAEGMYIYAQDWRHAPWLCSLPIWGVDLHWTRHDGELTVTVREWGELEAVGLR